MFAGKKIVLASVIFLIPLFFAGFKSKFLSPSVVLENFLLGRGSVSAQTNQPSSGVPIFEQAVGGVASLQSEVSSSEILGGNKLYLTSVSITGNVTVNSVSGLGLDWSLVKSLCTGRGGAGVVVYFAHGNATSGVVTASLSGQATNVVVSVTSYSNVDSVPIGAVVAANSNGIDGPCSGGTDIDSYTVPITVGDNSTVYGTGYIRLRAHTPGEGFVERDEIHHGSGGDVAGIFVQDNGVATVGSVSMTGTLSSATNWAVAAIEIRGKNSSQTGALLGDANGDNKVSGIDYVIWLKNYGKYVAGGHSNGDFNGDGFVSGSDYVIWLINYGREITPTIEPSPTISSTLTPEPSLNPTPTLTPTPTPSVSGQGIWLSSEEIMSLPMSGAGWSHVLSEAESNWGSANLGDNDSNHDVKTLAGALVAVRKNDEYMRNKTIQGLQSAMVSGLTRTLELARGLQTYVVAADIIGYRTPEFENWVQNMLDIQIPGRIGNGLYSNALRDSSNWGGHERASSVAAARYLNDNIRLQELARAHREFVGENTSPKMLIYENTNWHADAALKAGVNREGAIIQGINVSGVLPEDWRRAGEFGWPPPMDASGTNYRWEGMQGYVVTAVMLARANMVPLDAGSNAVARSMDILYSIGDYPESDDAWIPWLVNKYWGKSYQIPTFPSVGKGMAFTEWTHQ